MSPERSFLRRIAGDDTAQSAAGAGHADPRRRAEELVPRVVANLERILRTRQGTAPAQPDYGLPDLALRVHSVDEAGQQLERTLRDVVARYEPRLADVAVRRVPPSGDEDPFVLRFRITGRLREIAARHEFAVQTEIAPSGAVRVRA